MTKNNSDEDEEVDILNLHHGRLRTLLQALKDGQAEIKINLGPTGESRQTTYGNTKGAEYSLTTLLKTVWPQGVDDPLEASEYAINEYFRPEYEVVNRRPYDKKYNDAHYNVVNKITAFIPESDVIQNRDYKQQLFFSGDRRQATNILAAFPNFRKAVIHDFQNFAQKLRDNKDEFPYQHLRNYTAHRTHRYKKIEKSIFQYLKDAHRQAINNIQSNLLEIVESYIDHLQNLEAEQVNHDKPTNGQILENRLSFKELSDVDQIEINQTDMDFLDEVGFQNGFSDKQSWFDEFRFKKIDYWLKWLGESSYSSWPDFYLEHILLAYYELNNVCSKIVERRNEIFKRVDFRVYFSKDGVVSERVQNVTSLDKLAVVLSNYEYESIAFVKKLKSDGNLLQKPLLRLPDHFNQDEAYPDQLYSSRVEKLLWEYLISRMCNSCQLAEKHVIDYYTPLYKPNQ